MKIVVIGGSGLIGKGVVEKLTAQGHEVLSASPRSGVDATTGRGLAEALAGAEVVVDVSNSPSFEDAAVLAFFEHQMWLKVPEYGARWTPVFKLWITPRHASATRHGALTLGATVLQYNYGTHPY